MITFDICFRFDNARNKLSDACAFSPQLLLGSTKYSLLSMIQHIGKTLDSGHYRALCKIGSKLFTFDDDKVIYFLIIFFYYL